MCTVEVSLPPLINQLSCDFNGEVARAQQTAVARLEAGFGRNLAPLADFLLRSESVASSKIEHVDAGWRAFGKAFAEIPICSTEIAEDGFCTRAEWIGRHASDISRIDVLRGGITGVMKVAGWPGGARPSVCAASCT